MKTNKYTTGTWSSQLDEEIILSTYTIVEEDKGPVFTGLFTPNGDKIYRQPETVKLGFNLSERSYDQVRKNR